MSMINLFSAPIIIDNYRYIGFHGYDSCCKLYVWPKQNIVVAQHIENGGTSPMQRAEHLAEQVIKEFKLNAKKTTWINHVPAELHTSFKEDFNQIDFSIKKTLFNSKTQFNNAIFNHISKDSLLDCINGKLHFNLSHKISYAI